MYYKHCGGFSFEIQASRQKEVDKQTVLEVQHSGFKLDLILGPKQNV